MTIDFSRDSLFDELGVKRLKESYMREDEESPQANYPPPGGNLASQPSIETIPI